MFDKDSCPYANYVLNISFIVNSYVRDIVLENEERFYNITKEAYGMGREDIKFPAYFELLESIVAVKRQYKDTFLHENEETFMENFTGRLYHYAKAGDTDAVLYRSWRLLNYTLNFFQRSLTDKGKRPKVAFIFLDDDMLLSVYSQVGGSNLKEVLPSSMLALTLYRAQGDSKEMIRTEFNDEVVKMRYKKKEVRSYAEFAEAVKEMKERDMKQDYASYCKISPNYTLTE
eukprot:TRINITY_DN12163_c0_g5_i4.p1 TRINITY_DN12163_c0_g5~~TRINITY_DN12163_c0_g5_i4.p1  ORF type:complete len:266 (-),score=88.42 TRINITY_DN12163_c0_g5_i4:26-715(-)